MPLALHLGDDRNGGILTSSYSKARASAVRSVKRPSPGRRATGKKRRSGRSQPDLRGLPSVAAHGDKAQMVGAYLGRQRIEKVALDAPQSGRIGCVG